MISVPCLFVLGVPRSGNTVLASLLNKSKDIFFFEDTLVRKLLRVLLNCNLAHPNDCDALISEFIEDERLKTYLPLDDHEYRDFPNIGAFVNHLFERLIENNEVIYFGDKAPNMMRYLPELLSVFTAAKILFVVRDPRDNVFSLMKRQYISLYQSCLLYDEYNNEMVRFNGLLGDEKSLVIRFEDILQDSERTIRRVYSFLDISFTRTSLDLSEYDAIKDSYVLPTLDASKIGKWKRNLSPKEVRKIEQFLNVHFVRNNYDISHKHVVARVVTNSRFIFEGVIWDIKGLFISRKSEMRSKKLVTLYIPVNVRIRRLLYNLFFGIISGKFKPRI